ncbi:MAG: hypothetical protein JJU12_00290 [Chlamydiales bacterium]|nr:hypothetical protein [Chlamydiales bacterium]
MTHRFIFTPGVWSGEGVITFSMAEDVLNFKMEWTILPAEEGKIYFNQVIAVAGFSDKMRNNFSVSDITASDFEIELENGIVGRVVGKGVVGPKVIAWEFRRKDQEFEGYEIYELQESGSYKMRAEFTAGDGLRTHVEGFIDPSANN